MQPIVCTGGKPALTAINVGIAQKRARRRPRAACVDVVSVHRPRAVCVGITIWAHVCRDSGRKQQHGADGSNVHPRTTRRGRAGAAMRSRLGSVLSLALSCRALARAAVRVRGPLAVPAAGRALLRSHPGCRGARSSTKRPCRARKPRQRAGSGSPHRRRSRTAPEACAARPGRRSTHRGIWTVSLTTIGAQSRLRTLLFFPREKSRVARDVRPAPAACARGVCRHYARVGFAAPASRVRACTAPPPR